MSSARCINRMFRFAHPKNTYMTYEQQAAIWIVDDDRDDLALVREIFDDMGWDYPLEVFTSGEDMMNRLTGQHTAPFIIISGVHLPKMSGFELREHMLANPDGKFHSVPFIFWSSTASEAQIRKAFRLGAHGFFIKEPELRKWRSSFRRIIEYWRTSLMPSKEETAH